MNCGGNYYYVIFWKDGVVVDKGQRFVYREFSDIDAHAIAKQEKFEYDRYEADFLREQSGDEM